MEKQKKILILGGANLHCKLVKAAKEMGVYTIVTDYLENSPAKAMADKSYMYNITDIDAIVNMCREEGVDGVISTHLDPCQRPYQQICEKLGVPCYIDNWDQVFALTDKDAFKELCQKNNVDIIPSYEMEDIYDEEKAKNIEYPVLVKPSQSRGSRGQSVCNSLDEIKEAIEIAKKESDCGRAIVEKYMGNKNDFTMTYFFIDGKPYMTKTSDRYLGAIELGLEKVGIGTVSPSYYTDMYLDKVHNRVINMIKSLDIKNGPVFMQGFVDGKTVRFYDPGFRFPGSEYDTMFADIWDIDIMKMMVEFALTGKFSHDLEKFDDELFLLKGKSVITLFPTIKAGKIKEIKGLDKLEKMPEVICYTLRHNVGDEVGFTKDVNQRIAEIDIVGKDYDDLKNLIDKVNEIICVADENGEQMNMGNLKSEMMF